jgi:MoxR-like ATPase
MSDWLLYRGVGKRHNGISRLPGPPNWRTFDAVPEVQPRAAADDVGWSVTDVLRAASYRPQPSLLQPVNAALYLRRPLLVTGNAGVGKSTLAYAVAYELGLGPVLRWSITSRSTLLEGLYRYDAISRLQDVNMNSPKASTDIGRYIRLGPLGTALLPVDTPRVLLIDEIDKADLDLPNDLLTVFEEGEYEIPELARIADIEPNIKVTTSDAAARMEIRDGRVRCRQFPVVVMTNNGERDFPPAFLRRCVRLDIEAPNLDQLATIVEARLGAEMKAASQDVIERFHQRAQEGDLATDQLLNAIHLTCQIEAEPWERDELIAFLLRHLSAPSSGY